MSAKTGFVILFGWMRAAAAFGDHTCKDDSVLRGLAHVEDSVQLMQVSAGMLAARVSESNANDSSANESMERNQTESKELHANESRANESMERNQTESKEPRVVLYVTTVGSEQHISYLDCYPMFNYERLRNVDVIMHVGQDSEANASRRTQFTKYLDRWTTGKKAIHYMHNEGYANGAMKAMHDAFSAGWFDGYDWVIRINPDVVIYNEKPLFSFLDMPNVSAVFNKCFHKPRKHQWHQADIHTDFFAVRPEKLDRNAWASYRDYDNAEEEATLVFKPIIDSKAYVTLPGATRSKLLCRIHGGGIWHSTEFCHDTLQDPPWMRGKRMIEEADMSAWKKGWETPWDETGDELED